MRVLESNTTQPIPDPKWLTVIAVPMIVLGVIAITFPFLATIASTLLFGGIFIGAGIVQIIYAFQSKGAGKVVWKLILGLLYLLTGIFVAVNPLQGVLALTLVLGITIFIQGMIQVVLAFQLRHKSANWGWILASGLVGMICGIFVWSSFPFSALWLLGTLLGVDLIFDGIWMLLPHSEQPQFIDQQPQTTSSKA